MHLMQLDNSTLLLTLTCSISEVQEVGMHTNRLESLETSGSLEKPLQNFTVSVSSATQHDLRWTRCCLEGLCDLTQMLWKRLEQGIKSRGVKE